MANLGYGAPGLDHEGFGMSRLLVCKAPETKAEAAEENRYPFQNLRPCW